MDSNIFSEKVNDLASLFNFNIKFGIIESEITSSNVESNLMEIENHSCKHVDILSRERIASRLLGYIPEQYLKDSYGVRIDMPKEKREALNAEYRAIKESAKAKERAYYHKQYLKSLGVR